MDLGFLGLLGSAYGQTGWPKRAAGWEDVGQSVQGSGIPGLLGGGIGGGLGALTGNPIISAILASIGSQAATSLIGSLFGSQSPGEQAALGYTQAGQRLLPQLEAQARGMPTAASNAQQQQLQQAMTRMQQSYSASARRSGGGSPTLGGGQPTPSRAQQGRLQAAQLPAMAGIMGQAQTSATQQLTGLGQYGLGIQRDIEMQESAARGRAVSGMAQLFADMQNDTEQKEFDDTLKAAILDFMAALKAQIPGTQTNY